MHVHGNADVVTQCGHGLPLLFGACLRAIVIKHLVPLVGGTAEVDREFYGVLRVVVQYAGVGVLPHAMVGPLPVAHDLRRAHCATAHSATLARLVFGTEVVIGCPRPPFAGEQRRHHDTDGVAVGIRLVVDDGAELLPSNGGLVSL